ncbi:hypothetical protein [Microcystis aeruginosa]|uniref:SH3b domain-containing protein n=1 Tax=Microcystis aeruginosa PCC 9808 TaxID=1160284 RepID=I4HQE1_MICAE|nr:hypothetical protein [Microcystis aeruginosa]CCI24265.1 hypothetical protein MICAG_240016 [Microcystis aeruginosa PCC 9808]
MSRPDPAGNFENSEPGAHGQLPGEDPKIIHKNYDAGFASLSAGSSVFLQVKSTGEGEYVNIDSGGWAQITKSAETKYVLVPYYENYYVVVASGDWKGYYLSYNRNYYVGAYRSWINASYWSVEPLDCSPYPGLYSYKKSHIFYLCCNGVADKISPLIHIFSP